MKSVLCSVLPVCIILLSGLNAQSVMTYERQYNLLVPTWYTSNGADHIGMGRAGIARAGVSSSAFINPAGMRVDRSNLDIGTWWRPTTSNTADFSFTQATPLPSFLSFSIPSGSFGLQFGIARMYDEKITSPEFPLTTVDHPEGGIGTIRLITVGSVHTAFASVSWSPHPDLSVGMTAGVDHIDFKTTFGTASFHLIGTGWRVIGGTLVHVASGADVGFAVRYTAPADLAFTNSIGLVRMDPDPAGTRNDRIRYQTGYGARAPMEFEIGTSVQALSWLTAMLAFQREVWSMAVSPSADVWQIRAGIEANVLTVLILRVGTYTQTEPGYGRNEYLDQQFVTCGATVDVSTSFQLSVAFHSSAPFARAPSQFGFVTADKSFHRSEFVGGISIGL